MGAELKEEKVPTQPKSNETPSVFGDPDSYEHLSKEERLEMTERMKKKLWGIHALRNWSQEKRNA